MQLLYTSCVPKLTYGAAVKDLSSSEKNQFNVAVNNAVRRIFGFHCWQSIRQLREFYSFKSIEDLYSNARRRFLDSIMYHKNETLRFLSQLLRESEEMERSRVPGYIIFFPIARFLPPPIFSLFFYILVRFLNKY